MNRLVFKLYTCLRETESQGKMALFSAVLLLISISISVLIVIISNVDADLDWAGSRRIICAILIQQFMFPGDCSTKVSRQT